MSNTYAASVWPVVDRYVGLAEEATAGTAVQPTFTHPMTTFKYTDKITPLKDEAWRGSMAELYNLINGVRIDDVSMGGPLFADGVGYWLLNIMGDYSVAMSNPGTTTTVLAANAGTTAVTLISGTLATSTPYLYYLTGSSGFAEVVTASAGSGTGPYTLTRGLYYAHGSGATIAASTTNSLYTHTFSLLNTGAGPGGFSNAQPRTLTLTDWTGVPATSGARALAYTCLSEMSISGSATGLVEWDAKAMAIASTIPGTKPSITLSSEVPYASWLTTVTIGGSQVFDNAEYKLTLARKVEPKFTNMNQQDPYAIPRGGFAAGVSYSFDPAQDETQLLQYLNWTQPTISIAASNQAAGTAARSVTISGQVNAFDTGELDDSKETFGYSETAQLVANTTNSGVSGGFSPVSIAVQNAVPSY
jgi:hypothetical protein